jgi:putative hydrolase
MPGMPGFGLGPQGASNDPLPITTVRETAKKFVTAHGVAPLSTRDQGVVASAYEIAEIWLNEATTFPSALSSTHASAVNRADWVDLTIAGWHRDIAPLAQGLLEAMTDLLAQAGREQSLGEGEGSQIPLEAIGGLLKTFIGSMVATQLGQSVGSLAATVTGAHDAGLPILDPARPVLIPENIAAWAADLEIPQSEVFIFHALRESAVARLFAHNPWLVSYIQSTITEYGRGIRIDLEAIQRQAEEAMNNFDPSQPINNQINLNVELNKEIIALNQDTMGKQGYRWWTLDGKIELWIKPLSNNEIALCFFNRSEEVKNIDFDWNKYFSNLNGKTYGVTDKTIIRDLWLKKNIGTTKNNMKAVIQPHDVLTIKLSK